MMKNETKSVKFNLLEGEKTVSFDFIDIDEPLIEVRKMMQEYPDGCLLFRNHEFQQTQFMIHKSRNFKMLVFDEKGEFISRRSYDSEKSSPFGLFVPEPFVFLLHPQDDLAEMKIKSFEIVLHDYEPLVKDKSGVYSYIHDQCPDTCTCGKGSCRYDDIFFGLNSMYYEYRSNLLKANKIKEEFIARINKEDIMFMRKQFGMYSQFNFLVTDISKKLITIETYTGRTDLDPFKMILSVRNGLLNFYEDLLPVPGCLFKHHTYEDKILLFEKELDFWTKERSELKSNIIPIEEIVVDIRAKLRPIYEDYLSKLKIIEIDKADSIKEPADKSSMPEDQKRLTEFMKALNGEKPMTKDTWKWWRNRY